MAFLLLINVAALKRATCATAATTGGRKQS
jgi:hypothetical protein